MPLQNSVSLLIRRSFQVTPNDIPQQDMPMLGCSVNTAHLDLTSSEVAAFKSAYRFFFLHSNCVQCIRQAIKMSLPTISNFINSSINLPGDSAGPDTHETRGGFPKTRAERTKLFFLHLLEFRKWTEIDFIQIEFTKIVFQRL